MDARSEHQTPEKPAIVSPTFVLLLGPSGVGKTEIMRRLENLDPRIVITPVYTDRPPRAEDTGRVSVSRDEFASMEEEGKFLNTLEIYGNHYAISRSFVTETLAQGKVPIQDFPVERVKDLKGRAPIYTIYILPPSLSSLRERLGKDGRDPTGSRYNDSKEELMKYAKLHFETDSIDDVVINKDLNKATRLVLNSIYSKVAK